MFLLNPAFTISTARTLLQFTFHYVSIKSDGIWGSATDAALFTFHYVSIKSWNLLVLLLSVENLHSTMFLLNRRKGA